MKVERWVLKNEKYLDYEEPMDYEEAFDYLVEYHLHEIWNKYFKKVIYETDNQSDCDVEVD